MATVLDSEGLDAAQFHDGTQTIVGGYDMECMTRLPRALGQFPKPSLLFHQNDRLKLAQVMHACTPALCS